MMRILKTGCSALVLLFPAVASPQGKMFTLQDYFREAGENADMVYMLSRCAGLFGALADLGPDGLGADNFAYLGDGMEAFIQIAFTTRTEGMMESEMNAIAEELRADIGGYVTTYAEDITANITQFGGPAPAGSNLKSDLDLCVAALEST